MFGRARNQRAETNPYGKIDGLVLGRSPNVVRKEFERNFDQESAAGRYFLAQGYQQCAEAALAQMAVDLIGHVTEHATARAIQMNRNRHMVVTNEEENAIAGAFQAVGIQGMMITVTSFAHGVN